ncbi:MAG: RIP metalloprotease [Hyphomonadaceae bacterium]
MEKLISVLASPIPYLILISVVITIHELGHYLAGRLFGAAAESFSLGFGKSLVEVTDKRGTRWRLNWLPLGGFVKFVGEMQTPADSMAERPPLVGKPFPELTPWQRLFVAFGGPLANFVFAVVIFAGFAMTMGVPQATEVRVAQVHIGTPADQAGFEPGDIFVMAGGRAVKTTQDVYMASAYSAGETVRYTIRRGDQTINLSAIPEPQVERNEALQLEETIGKIGLVPTSAPVKFARLNPIDAVAYGTERLQTMLGTTANVIRRLVTGKESLDKLSGPLGILNVTDKITDLHMKQADVPIGEKIWGVGLDLINFAALISIGVGFFNLLPIPVLDGGAMLICLAEGVMRRPVPESIQRVGLSIGLACLIGFAVLITWNDLIRFRPLETIAGIWS